MTNIFRVLLGHFNFWKGLKNFPFFQISGSPHLTQEEILDYSHIDDFEVMDDEIDGNNSRHPPMTDDESDESEIDLENPYDDQQ